MLNCKQKALFDVFRYVENFRTEYSSTRFTFKNCISTDLAVCFSYFMEVTNVMLERHFIRKLYTVQSQFQHISFKYPKLIFTVFICNKYGNA